MARVLHCMFGMNTTTQATELTDKEIGAQVLLFAASEDWTAIQALTLGNLGMRDIYYACITMKHGPLSHNTVGERDRKMNDARRKIHNVAMFYAG